MPGVWLIVAAAPTTSTGTLSSIYLLSAGIGSFACCNYTTARRAVARRWCSTRGYGLVRTLAIELVAQTTTVRTYQMPPI